MLFCWKGIKLMKKFETLMSKWWFRLALIAGFTAILFIVNISLATSYNGDRNKLANDGVLNVVGWFTYLAVIPMYFATDILNNMRFKIGKFLRKVILLIALAICVLSTFGLISYLISVNSGKEMRPFEDGFGIAPFITFTLLYHFVVGKYEVINKEPNRMKQFIVTLVAYIAPLIVGVLLILVLKSVDNSTISFIALIALILILVGSFVISIKKYGLALGGAKELEKEMENIRSSSTMVSGESNDWTSEFEHVIGGGAYGTYVDIDVSAKLRNNKIYVLVRFNYFGSSDASITASRNSEIAKEIDGYYRDVAKKCPYASQLNKEIKE